MGIRPEMTNNLDCKIYGNWIMGARVASINIIILSVMS